MNIQSLSHTLLSHLSMRKIILLALSILLRNFLMNNLRDLLMLILKESRRVNQNFMAANQTYLALK